MNSASTDRPRVLLIDLDNCPHDVLELEKTATHFDLIIASHGSTEPRVPLGLAGVIGRLIAERKMEIWAMPPGKNSADFCLTFLAGRLSAQQTTETHFQIASKDKDLDHAISLLRRSGFKAKRIDSSSKAVAGLPVDRQKTSDAAALLAKSLSGAGAKSRPRTQKTLVSTASARGETPAIGLVALKELIHRGAICYDEKNVAIYDAKKLESAAAKAPAKNSAAKKKQSLCLLAH